MQTRFVKTPQQVQAFLSLHSKISFLRRRGFVIRFETDPEFIKAILPPPLEPTDSCVASAVVGEVGSSNVGPFRGASVNVPCRYGDIVGQYCLAMTMDTETSTIFGRELFGEPKKIGRITIERLGTTVSGSMSRHGINVTSMRAKLTEQLPDLTANVNNFHFKLALSADGSGLDRDPQLICASMTVAMRNVWRGEGELRFYESAHDPLSDVPIRRVTEAVWSEDESHANVRVLATVDADQVFPYLIHRYDDLSRIAGPEFA